MSKRCGRCSWTEVHILYCLIASAPFFDKASKPELHLGGLRPVCARIFSFMFQLSLHGQPLCENITTMLTHGRDISTKDIQGSHCARCNSSTGKSPCSVELHGTHGDIPSLFLLPCFAQEIIFIKGELRTIDSKLNGTRWETPLEIKRPGTGPQHLSTSDGFLMKTRPPKHFATELRRRAGLEIK